MTQFPILGGILAATICMIWHLICGRELLYAVVAGGAVMFATAIVLVISLRVMSVVLIRYLQEKRAQSEPQEDTVEH